MLFHADVAWLMAVALVAVRFGPLFLTAPGLGSGGLPVHVHLLLTVALSVCLVPAVGLESTPLPQTPGTFLAAALGEFTVSMVLRAGLLMAFAVFQLAGQMLGTQIGFSVANVFDPITRTQSPLLGAALDLLGIPVPLASSLKARACWQRTAAGTPIGRSSTTAMRVANCRRIWSNWCERCPPPGAPSDPLPLLPRAGICRDWADAGRD